MDASPLGAIPAEVRNIIYEFYFAYDEVDIRSRRPALLSTCKQLRNEALSVSYYAPTAFSVTILSDPLDTSLIKWLQIEERRSWLALIQSFKIYTGVQFVWEDFWLENLAALETAGFGADQVDFLIPRDQAWIQDQQMASETVDFTTHIRLRTAMREEASVHRLRMSERSNFERFSRNGRVERHDQPVGVAGVRAPEGWTAIVDPAAIPFKS
ncbi:hypothetical protein LTR10_008807 [Elasticomyces elasticus]|nr:hypothetical protein LTR10_008807 [Elasticomyces elasticus]